MNFGEALYQLKNLGERLSRENWVNGQYIYYVPRGEYPVRTDAAKKEYLETVPYGEYIAFRDKEGVIRMYSALVEDIFAEDWYIY